MMNIIKSLKQRMEKNYQVLQDEDIRDLTKPILETINLLLSANAPDNQIKSYLQGVNSSIEIIEEKLERIEKKEK